MTVAYEGHGVTVHIADALDVLAGIADASVDAVVTDPPYGLEFMGKEWDAPWKQGADVHAEARNRRAEEMGDENKRRYIASAVNKYAAGLPFQQWCEMWATECLRVLKPGGHLLAFGGTRTWHRLACAVEDAGFEVRDSIAWMYGSGFPKSLDVSKAIDKAAGAEREGSRSFAVEGGMGGGRAGWTTQRCDSCDRTRGSQAGNCQCPDAAPATDAARQWEGWGTALKPAFEPVVVARKPLIGTVAATVLAHGTGALNIDGCRVAVDPNDPNIIHAESRGGTSRSIGNGTAYMGGEVGRGPTLQHPQGRWPANVVLDESQAEALDEQSGESAPKPARTGRKGGCSDNGTMTGYGTGDDVGTWPADAGGGASRFFYVAKAPTSERPRYKREGGSDNATTYGQMKKRECNVCGNRTCPAGGEQSGKPWPTCGHDDWSWVEQQSARDEFVAHPTVKPLSLMRWLVRLVTPPGGTVLDPFAGSGTTAEACILEGFRCVTIDKEPEHLPLILQRINRQRDPVEAIRQRGEDLGLFDHLEGAP